MTLGLGRQPIAFIVLSCLCGASLVLAQQVADPGFVADVPRPAYSRGDGPIVVIDEAHANGHTAPGNYKPFAELLENDGFIVLRGTSAFTDASLRRISLLVISNAQVRRPPSADAGAFTSEECDVLTEWVRQGGALLLISDHSPSGDAAKELSRRFDVEMGTGFVFDRENSDSTNPSWLVFSEGNGLLGEHPILRGRDSSERVKRVVTFTGQSLTVPKDGAAILKLGSGAIESASRQDLAAAVEETRNGATLRSGVKRDGRAQAVALTFGRGRVVVFGEAAIFSAQVQLADGRKAGMNIPGTDDKQLALNVVRWLSRVGE